MKHSVQDLIATACEYFPRGISRRDPGYEETPEVAHQKAARIPASARYDAWRNMLQRLRERFPKEQFPDLRVENCSLFLQSATAAVHLDRCYTGKLYLPVHGSEETQPELEFLVSFVVPYYVLQSPVWVQDPEPPEVPAAQRPRIVIVGNTCYCLPPDPNAVDDEPQERIRLSREIRRFEIPPEQAPFAKAIVEEIEATFPGYEPISAEVGLTIVPDVQAGSHMLGESTIFACLFSDNW